MKSRLEASVAKLNSRESLFHAAFPKNAKMLSTRIKALPQFMADLSVTWTAYLLPFLLLTVVRDCRKTERSEIRVTTKSAPYNMQMYKDAQLYNCTKLCDMHDMRKHINECRFVDGDATVQNVIKDT